MSCDVYLTCPCCGTEVFTENHTSNQSPMWRYALGESLGDLVESSETAGDLLPILEAGITKLESEGILRFDSPNGWGSGESGLQFLKSIHSACAKHPWAKPGVSR